MSSSGEVLHIYQGNSFEAAVENLKAGDTLIVHEGIYSDTGRISISVRGTSAAPVIIEAAQGEARPHITRSATAPAQNTINVEGAAYLTIRGLEISSNTGDGINLKNNPSFITLENLVIHDVDVGINFRSDMHHITVRRNHIHRTGAGGGTGEGLYVGCNYATCVVSDSLIEGNWIHNTLQSTQGDGIEIKRGSHSIIVRDNVIHDTNFPCVLVGGTEGHLKNVIEGNAMWNCGDSGIQATADAVIRNNLILDSPGDGFNSQDHQGVTPNNIEFVHNTLIGGNPCVRVSNWSNKQGMVFANNAVYCGANNFRISGLTGVTVVGNVFFPATSSFPAAGNVIGRSSSLDFLDTPNHNVYPTPDSSLINVGSDLFSVPVDFNGTARTGRPDAGAYTWTTDQNPGWRVVPGFKPLSQPAKRPLPPTNLRVN